MRQFYHCFGCQASGDVFSFVGKIENVSFPEAVRIVAQKCGIPLPKREFSSPEEAAGARQRTKLLELHETATAWFEEQLRGPEGAVAREYLAGRGLTPEGIKTFRIGYAPDSFNALRDRLSGMADDETLRASGLFSSKEQGDGTPGHTSTTASASASCFPSPTRAGASSPSPRARSKPATRPAPSTSTRRRRRSTPRARCSSTSTRPGPPSARSSLPFWSRGRWTASRVFLRGIQNVIATSGTAFTEQQVALLRRHTSNVVVNFDPDAAGATPPKDPSPCSPKRALDHQESSTLDGRPRTRTASSASAGVRGVSKQRRSPRTLQRRASRDYLIERARQMFPGASAEQKVKAMNYLLPHIRRMPEKLARDQFAADAAQKLGIDSAVLREELRQAALSRRDHVEAAPPRSLKWSGFCSAPWPSTDPENEPPAALRPRLWPSNPPGLSILAHLPPCRPWPPPGPRPHGRGRGPGPAGLACRGAAGRNQAPRGVEVESAIQEIQERAIENRQRELRALIAEAERRGDFAELALLTQQKLDLDRALRELHNRKSADGEDPSPVR